MDLADFPRLRGLNLSLTEVTGDIRDISENDFPALKSIRLPKTVAGGVGYEFQHTSEVPSFMQAIHLLIQRNSMMFHKERLSSAFDWALSEGSPDWYPHFAGCTRPPPFFLRFLQLGPMKDHGWYRLGWCWSTSRGRGRGEQLCEINWINPEPSNERSGYETYIEDLQNVQQNIDFYRDYYQPPNEEEYRRLCGV